MTLDHIAVAQAHIANLITGAVIANVRLYNNGVRTVVDCAVTHPKRTIDPTSFVRSAKKKGLIGSGTPSASNRNKLIVAYVTVEDGSELMIKGTNEGHLNVEVRFKN